MAKARPFTELIAETTRSAVHLETRDAYTPDDPAFLAWLAGRPVSALAGADWYDLVREHRPWGRVPQGEDRQRATGRLHPL